MEENYELTTSRYFFELGKIFLRSLVAHYFKRDDAQLEKLYYDTMDIHDQYIEQNCDDEEKEERFRDKIYELLELISLREQEETLKIKYSGRSYRGMKLRENIINDIYLELWILGEDLWIYIFEPRGKKEDLLPFDIEDPYLVRLDQVYYALKNKRMPGLLNRLYEKERIKNKDIVKI